ncbi:glycoside hydrolase family 13 protein [Affinibrenneria salicis]|nr:alpha-glucosidase [Affinibrenneria salicis]
MTATSARQDTIARQWWKEAVVYQIYPRSFNDSNGDGIGDLNGITEKLDYLQQLGVNVIWLSPHFDSPNADNGYDIRDYRKVMKEFGTMADFDRMLAGIRQRGMRLIIDLVVNHTSDEHQWFVDSRSSRDDPKRDYYIWRDGKGDNPPNNYTSFFGGSAWRKDEHTGQYYLHYFAVKQPDLNWDNEQVREEVYQLMRFWLDKGVSGFRMDVIPFISKRDGLPDLSAEQLSQPEKSYACGPRLHDYLQEMNRKVLAHYDSMTVGEAFGVSYEQAPLFTDSRRNELNMIFHFDLVRLDRDGWRKTPWTLSQLRAVFGRLDQVAGEHGWNTSFLTNHDNPRAVSHFGDDSPQWRAASAKALATMSLTQRATPFIYQGDELGMTNYPFVSKEQYEDIEVRGLWQELVAGGEVTEKEFLDHMRCNSRDNARTPFQWRDAPHGGFTTGTPWLAVNPNYRQINAAAQLDDPDSVYHYYRRLIAVRRRVPALIYGAWQDLEPNNESVFAYTRTLNQERYLVVINFARQSICYRLPAGLSIGECLLSCNAGAEAACGDVSLDLQPWQAAIYRLS